MPTFIKTGFWEKAKKGYREWLNLDELVQSLIPSPPPEPLPSPIDVYQSLGMDVLAVNTGVPWFGMATTGRNLTGGILPFQSFYISKKVTLTGVRYPLLTSAGSYTAVNFNGFGLYKSLPNTVELVAQSASDSNNFIGTNLTIKSIPFTTPYIAEPGIYYVCMAFIPFPLNPTVPQISAIFVTPLDVINDYPSTTGDFITGNIGLTAPTLPTSINKTTGFSNKGTSYSYAIYLY